MNSILNTILNLLGSTKNVLMFILGLFGVGYIATQKYQRARAETKLKNIQLQIADTNVKIAKNNARSIAQSKDIENQSEIQLLKALNYNAVKVEQEMIGIESSIKNAVMDKEFNKANKELGKEIKVNL